MKYLLDTANLDEIRELCEYLPVAGVTSNPSIVKKEGAVPFFAHMREIRSIIGNVRPLHIQVTARDYDGMMRDADAVFRHVDEKVYIKVPVDFAGVKVIKALKRQGANVTATAVYGMDQAFIALEAGADCIAPYFNRMEALGVDAASVVGNIAGITAVNLSVLKNDRARAIRFSTLVAVCRALDCGVGDLLEIIPAQSRSSRRRSGVG